MIGADRMVGLFINTLPVRADLTPSTPFVSLLRKLQSQQLEARSYDYSPLAEVQKWSDVAPDVSLFESILVFENYLVDGELAERAEPLEIQMAPSIERTTYPLTLVAVPDGSRLLLRAIYDTGRFDDPAIEALLGHLERLLASVAADPQQAVSDVPILGQAERRVLLSDWSATRSEAVPPGCVHEWVAARAAADPDALAVVRGDEYLPGRVSRSFARVARR